VFNKTLLDRPVVPGELVTSVLDLGIQCHRKHRSPVRPAGTNHSPPADVYFGRGKIILLERERIKRDTITTRHLQHCGKAAGHQLQMRQMLSSITRPKISIYLTADILRTCPSGRRLDVFLSIWLIQTIAPALYSTW
jgi:hypothetical protein